MSPRAEAAEFVTMWFTLAIIAIAIASVVALVLDHRQHRRTDPACVYHRPPVTAVGPCRTERNRGRICPTCCARCRHARARDRARREVRHG